MLTHAGLFEGYGGTTMAAELALGPLDTRWYSDIKPASVALLAHRLPGVPNLGDMTEIDYTAAPRIDVLTASWPCQPHSSAGKRLGEADPRALWPHVARAIAQLRPALFLGENVARVAGNGELRRVVRSLADLGYVGAWRVLSAADRGACHLRKRCFVAAVDPAVADASGIGGTDVEVRGDGTALPLGAVPGAGVGDRARRAAAGVRELGGASSLVAAGGLTLLPTPTQSMTTGAGTSGRDGGLNLQTAAALLPTPSASSCESNRGGAAGRVGPVRESLDTMARRDRIASDRWGVYAAAVERWEQVLGRPAPDPTQPSAKTGKPQLAPRFVEWMMGLPEGHVCDVPGLTRSQQLSLLGDGVVPQQGAAAYRFLLTHLAERLAADGAA